MVYNLKQMLRRFVTLLVLLALITPSFYLPSQAKKAEAFWGFGDITSINIKDFVDRLTDGIAMVIAQQMVDHIVQSTVKWAQSGFDGNPAYVTDPEQYFTDLGDGIAGDFIKNNENLNFLCSPFQAQIRLSLLTQYSNPERFQCTLTQVVGNIENFYDDFSQGGWDAWFSMTQNPVNNPYGAYLEAKVELQSQIAQAVGIKNQELNWSQGFLSWKSCPGSERVDPDDPTKMKCYADVPNTDPTGFTQQVTIPYKTNTPGSSIKDGLDKVLPSGLNKLITAQHLDQLISSFASGLLTRYVFGDKGLFAGGSGNTAGAGASATGYIDQDGDLIPEGRDLDYDGKLESKVDVCVHGGFPPNCTSSVGLTASPYFAPVCEAVSQSIVVLKEYNQFLQSHRGDLADEQDFKVESDSRVWGSRTEVAYAGTSDILSAIKNSPAIYLDRLEIRTNRLNVFLHELTGSLFADGNDLDIVTGNGSGGADIDGLIGTINEYTQYFIDQKQSFGNRCDKPDVSGSNQVPEPGDPPDIGDGDDYCSADGSRGTKAVEMEQYALGLLNGNPSVPPGDVARDLNSKYKLKKGEEAVYYPEGPYIGLVPFYLARPDDQEQVAGDWFSVWRGCGGSENPSYPTPSYPTPTSGTPNITSISPSSAVANQTILTIIGTNLTNTVQFFDGNNNRTTIVGSVNGTGTQTTVTVPGLPTGNATVRIYKDASNVSNFKTFQVTGASNPGPEATVQSFPAVTGFWGQLAHNPQNNTWLIAAEKVRLMSNDGSGIAPEFSLSTGTVDKRTKVAFAPDLNKFLVVWTDYAAIYGRFIPATSGAITNGNSQGPTMGNQFTIYTGPQTPLEQNSVLRYDTRNKKFVFVFSNTYGGNAKIATVSDTGVVGPIIDVAPGSDNWYPSLAVNANANEYCVAYDKRNTGKLGMRKVNAATGAVGAETTLSIPTGSYTNLVFNTTNNNYLLTWEGLSDTQLKGRIISGCSLTGSGSTFSIGNKLGSSGGGSSSAYNSQNNTYAVVAQSWQDSTNRYVLINSTGAKVGEGIAFSGGSGNVYPAIAPNTTDGSFAALSIMQGGPVSRWAPGIKKP